MKRAKPTLMGPARRVFEEIRARVRRGSPLNPSGVPYNLYNRGIHNFGSWRKAIERCTDLDYDSLKLRPVWTRERVLEALRLELRAGRSLASSTIPNRLRNAAITHYGSYRSALLALGISPDVAASRRRWSRHSLVTELRHAAVTMSESEIQFRHPHLVEAAQRWLGGWVKARRLAGIAPSPRRVKWTADRIIAELRAAAKGGPLKTTGVAEVLSSACRSCFGSWAKALEAAGVPRTPRAWRWTLEKTLAIIRNNAGKDGCVQIRKVPPGAYVAAVRYFGRWTMACRAAGVAPGRRGRPLAVSSG